MNENMNPRAENNAATKKIGGRHRDAFPKGKVEKRENRKLLKQPENPATPYLPGMSHPGVCRLEEETSYLLQSLQPSLQRRNQMLIRSLAIPYSLLRDAGDHTPRGRELLVKEFHNLVVFLLSLDSTIDADLDYIKFHVSSFFQIAVSDIRHDTGHTLPLPSPGVADSMARRKNLFSGYSHRLVKRHVHRAQHGNAKSLSILASFLLLKRGWPQLSDHKLAESIIDHQRYLSMQLSPISSSLEAAIYAVAKKCYGEKAPNIFSKLAPSHHASYNFSRKLGGAYGELVTEPYVPPTHQPAPSLGARNLPPRSSWERPILRTVNRSIGNWKLNLHDKVAGSWLSRLVEHSDPTRVSVVSDDPPVEFNTVRVQEIAEPGKFRLITAGDATLYTYLQGLQGALLTGWAKQKASTMRHGWEDEVCKWVAPKGWVWNSGDYKAATDQLNGSSSRSALNAVLDIFGLENLYTGLLDATIVYPDNLQFPGCESRVQQRNGQLMGHPLSFPLLCIINFAGLKAAVTECEADGRLTRPEGKFILDHTVVNGDDILFPCPPWFSPVWEKIAAELGLVLSVGKSYASEHFAMVNNVMFLMGEQGGRQVGYLNQKLVLNSSLKAGDLKKSPLEIGHAFNKMFGLFPMSRAFLSDCIKNRKLEATFGYQPNFFLDCKLGGLGVNKDFANGPIRLTSVQRRVAAACTENVVNSYLFATGKSVSGPLAKMLKVLPPVRLSTAANSEIWADRRKVDTQSITPDARLESSDSASYARWVAVFTSMTSSVQEKETRRLDVKKIMKVRPMKREKCLNLKPYWLFPELPAPATGFMYSYSTRKHGGAYAQLDMHTEDGDSE